MLNRATSGPDLRKRRVIAVMIPRAIACAVVVASLSAAVPHAPAPLCPTVGCFEAQATGVVAASLTGKAMYQISPSGEVLILLAAQGVTPITLIITRDAGGVPTAESPFVLKAPACDDDDDVEPAVDAVLVTVRGGPMRAPTWLARAQAGTVHLAVAPDGVLTGRFELMGCGQHIESGEPVLLTMHGTFRAGKAK